MFTAKVTANQNQNRGPAQTGAPQRNAAPPQVQGQYRLQQGRPQGQGQTNNAQRTGTGYTFTGCGQPMDTTRNQFQTDPICKKCRQAKSQKGTCGSPWHVPNQVPNQNQRV